MIKHVLNLDKGKQISTCRVSFIYMYEIFNLEIHLLCLFPPFLGKITGPALHLTTSRFLTAKPLVKMADFTLDFQVSHISCTLYEVECYCLCAKNRIRNTGVLIILVGISGYFLLF